MKPSNGRAHTAGVGRGDPDSTITCGVEHTRYRDASAHDSSTDALPSGPVFEMVEKTRAGKCLGRYSEK